MFSRCADLGMTKGSVNISFTNEGPEIKDSFSNFEQIFSGAPHRINPEEQIPGVFKSINPKER